MEHFSRNNAVARPLSNTDSIYSTSSSERPASFHGRNSSSSSRPTSYVPSYMNASVPQRKPAPMKTSVPHNIPGQSRVIESSGSAANPSSPVITSATKGFLLLAVAAEPVKTTTQHLEVLLKRHSYSGIAIVGTRKYEAALKQLRMNIFALIGRLSVELGIHTHFCESWSEQETSAAIEEAVIKAGNEIRTVLCTPGSEELGNGGDIITLDRSMMARALDQSFGFVHAVGRITFPRFWRNERGQQIHSSFLVTQLTDPGSAALVARAACDALLKQLANSYSSLDTTVGYAEDLLIPEPEPAETEDASHLFTQAGPMVYDSHSAPGESPTKLWNMWALQDEIGIVD